MADWAFFAAVDMIASLCDMFPADPRTSWIYMTKLRADEARVRAEESWEDFASGRLADALEDG